MSTPDPSLPTPGRLSFEDALTLAGLVKGKTVLQIGAYCGKGTAAIGVVAASVKVVEDYQGYQVGYQVCMQEFLRACHTAMPTNADDKVDLIIKDIADVSPDQLGKYDVVYVDADRNGETAEDLTVAEAILAESAPPDGGLLIWHEPSGRMVHRVVYAPQGVSA